MKLVAIATTTPLIGSVPSWYTAEVADDGWAVTFGTTRRGLGGDQPPPRCIKYNSPPMGVDPQKSRGTGSRPE